jgi:DNA-binding protein HU-beta
MTSILPINGVLLAGISNYEDGLTNGGALRMYDPAGGRSGEMLVGTAFAVGPLAAADVDGDGSLEVFVSGRSVAGRYPEAAPSMLLRNQGGRLTPVTRWDDLGLVTAACFTDLDGDGRPDLVLAREWAPPTRSSGALPTDKNIGNRPTPVCRGFGRHSWRLEPPLRGMPSGFPEDWARRHVAEDRGSPFGSWDVGSWWRSGFISRAAVEWTALLQALGSGNRWCWGKAASQGHRILETICRIQDGVKTDKNRAFIGFFSCDTRGRIAKSAPKSFRNSTHIPTKSNIMAKAAKALTKSQITAVLAEKAEITKKQALTVLEALSELAYKNAKNTFTFPGVGKLVLVNRKARVGRNPATGAEIKIPAKKVVKFRVAKAAKDAILGSK